MTLSSQTAILPIITATFTTTPTLSVQRRPLPNIQIRLRTLSLPRLLRLPLLHRFTRNPKPLNARRHATITRSLQYDLPNLLFARPIIERPFNVRRKLRAAVLAAQHGNVEEGAGFELEAWTRPDRAPAGFCYELRIG